MDRKQLIEKRIELLKDSIKVMSEDYWRVLHAFSQNAVRLTIRRYEQEQTELLMELQTINDREKRHEALLASLPPAYREIYKHIKSLAEDESERLKEQFSAYINGPAHKEAILKLYGMTEEDYKKWVISQNENKTDRSKQEKSGEESTRT